MCLTPFHPASHCAIYLLIIGSKYTICYLGTILHITFFAKRNKRNNLRALMHQELVIIVIAMIYFQHYLLNLEFIVPEITRNKLQYLWLRRAFQVQIVSKQFKRCNKYLLFVSTLCWNVGDRFQNKIQLK